jgi:hypothetical protein
MSETYSKLKELLDKQGKLDKEEIEKMIAAHGDMTPDELTTLEAERHKKERSQSSLPTMDEYLAASKILDTTTEGSEEYNKALKIVEAFEGGG